MFYEKTKTIRLHEEQIKFIEKTYKENTNIFDNESHVIRVAINQMKRGIENGNRNEGITFTCLKCAGRSWYPATFITDSSGTKFKLCYSYDLPGNYGMSGFGREN